MPYKIASPIASIESPPIPRSLTWLPQSPPPGGNINLSQAVPSYPPASDLQSHIARLASDDDISLYTDVPGLAPLRQRLAEDIQHHYGGAVTPADIAITAGANQAFALAVKAIARAGDNVIIPTPWFFNHHMWCAMNDIEVRALACRHGDGMCPDVNTAAGLIDDRTRAIVLVTPNNPTGAIYPPDLIGRFHDLAAAAGIALIIDETYRDFRADATTPPHRLFARPNWRDSFIHVYSFSKVYAMTGYRVGAVAGDPRLIDAVEKLLDCIAICAPHISQAAVLFAIDHLAAWVDDKTAAMARRGAAFARALKRAANGYQLVSLGAVFAYLRHPFANDAAETVARRLAGEHGLLLLPGSMFGPGQERYLRAAFANCPDESIDEAVARLSASR